MFRNNDISDGGRPILIAPADDAVISLADCKRALGISGSDQDSVLTAAIAGVTADLDPSQLGWLGRALRPQQWELQLCSFFDVRPDRRRQGYSCSPGWPGGSASRPFAAHPIPLPYPPLISVDSFKYLDVGGVDRTLVLGTDYRVLGQGQTFGKQSVAPVYGGAWPAARSDDASVRIRFTCGYDDDVNIMPPQLLSAICLGVRALIPLMTRDVMLFEDRVEGLGAKRYQNNPEIAKIVSSAIGSLLANLATS
jgi:hypothetical protein